MDKDKNFVSQAKKFCQMINAFMLICLFSVIFCSCEDNHKLKNKYLAYDSCLIKYREKNYIDEETYQKFKKDPTTLKEQSDLDFKNINAKTAKNKAKRDSLCNLLRSLEWQNRQLNNKHIGYLRIKRMWYNSDTQPWTYSGYTSVYLYSNTKGSSRILTRFGSIGGHTGTASLDIKGEAHGIGDNRFDYINVILSDNSFYQFSTKNNPEWLLVKEGDLVERNENNNLVPLFKK